MKGLRYLKIVLKVTNGEKVQIDPLFVSEDSSYNQTSLKTIIENMRNLLSDEQKEKVKFLSLYAGNYEFKDCPPMYERDEIRGIAFLLKMIEGNPNSILRISDSKYELTDYAELLNKEIKDPRIEYRVFDVRGKLMNN